MSAGIGMLGREVLVTIGGITVVGIVTKATERTNERLDTTDDQSSGNAEALAKPGLKALNFTVSGIMKNLELVDFYHSNDSQLTEIIITYADGVSTPSTETFDGFLDNINDTGESNGLVTFDAAFSSSGAIVYVAAT